MEKRVKTNPSQWAAFLDFAEEHPTILTKKFEGPQGKITYDKYWRQITDILNSMGYEMKPMDKWQKVSVLLLETNTNKLFTSPIFN